MSEVLPGWEHPRLVDDLVLAFPAYVVGTLLPPVEAIPSEFFNTSNPWCQLQRKWFMGGLPTSTQFHLRPGCEGERMMRHITACQRSYEPKHEHKEAGVAYLLSLWCTEVRIPGELSVGEG